MVYKYIGQQISAILFPKRCLITDQAIEPNSTSPFISATASNFLPRLHLSCSQCGLPLSTEGNSICGACQKQPPAFDRVISPFIYTDPISNMIRDLKFNNKLHYAAFFADAIKQRVLESYQTLPQLIMPIPLHRERLYQRGYNQAREVSRLLSRQLSITHNDQCLIRIKATDEQSGLNAKQRKQNLKNAFAIESNVIGIKHIALIDDVMTTGATANSVANTLKYEGVEQVDIWVVARTPK